MAQLISSDFAPATPRDLNDLAATLESLMERVAVLETERALMAMPEAEVAPDPAAAWVEKHQEDVARHAGKHIAVHPRLGIIASADSFAELYALVKDKNMLDEVVFDSVPA